MDTDEAVRLSPEEVVLRLRTDAANGLSSREASVRQGLAPPNELEHGNEDPLHKKFLEQFKDPLILLLLGSALLSLLIKQYDDAVSIFIAVTIVATVAFVQEYRSEKSLQALTKLLPPHATCLRDGKATDLMARELVPGDVVLVKSGDRIPADCRLVEAADLFADESSLTGEGHAHDKAACAVGASATGAPSVANDRGKIPLAECKSMVFMGTLVCGGHAKAVVTATGMRTEFGKTFEDMKEVECRRTPLQTKMDELGKQLSVLSFGIIAIIAIVGLLQGKKLLDMFNIGVSLAVAAIPEGLPICVTVTLALGVMRMAKRNAIVKRLPAVEALGCATVVCADKTGTLTRNEMTVKEVFVLSEEDIVEVSGIGYDPVGDFTMGSMGRNRVLPEGHPGLVRLLEAACLCNNATLEYRTAAEDSPALSATRASGGSMTGGQPTEICLLVAAQKFGVADPRPSCERIHEIAFTSARKRMDVRCRRGLSEEITYVKGAVESVLEDCRHFDDGRGIPCEMSDVERRRVLDVARDLGCKGRRVMAIAYGRSSDALVLSGLVGIMDLPRPNAIKFAETMQACSTRVCMITGDAEDTAVAVASAVGFFDPSQHRTLSGAEIEHMSLSELEAFVHDVAVFYRTSPRHKLSIVRALQAIGEVVVMTGDGVNDAPALKAADIGVAMGMSGSDVAKEAADMVLVDDDISTIIAAVEEGKGIFYNIKNFLTFQLSTALAALSIVALATFMGFKSPINAMQILWINIIMDGPPAQSLGVEPVRGAIMRQPPRKATDAVISYRLIFRVVTSAALIVAGTLWVFRREVEREGLSADRLTRRDTTMTFTTFVMFDMFNALCCRSADKIVPHMDLFANRAFIYSVGGSIVGQMLVVYFGPLQRVFQTEALPVYDLVMILLVASSMVVLDTARKVLIPERGPETSAWLGSSLMKGVKHGMGRNKLSMA